MSTPPYAGKSAPKELLIDVGRLEAAFYEGKPDPSDPNKLVSFGTSGHRGTSSNETFTESHFRALRLRDLFFYVYHVPEPRRRVR